MPPFSTKFFNPSLGDEMECFWRWVAAGANITACNSGEEGNGLFVAKDILQDEQLFFVASQFVVTAEKILCEQQQLGDVLRYLGPRCSEDMVLRVFLMFENNLAVRGRSVATTTTERSSLWLPWMRILDQTEVFGLLAFTGNADAEIVNDSLLQVLRQNLHDDELFTDFMTKTYQPLKEEYLWLNEQLFKRNPHLFEDSTYSWASYCWSASWIESHAISMRGNTMGIQNKGTGRQAGGMVKAMVPLVHLCNHTFATSNTPSIHPDGVSLLADHDMKEGEQIFINYGLKSNAALLVQYGFVLENNPCDSLKIPLQLSRKDEPPEVAEARASLLRKFGMKDSQALLLANSPRGYGADPSEDTIAPPHNDTLVYAIITSMNLAELEELEGWMTSKLREGFSSDEEDAADSSEELSMEGLGMWASEAVLDNDEIMERIMVRKRAGYKVLLDHCIDFLARQHTSLLADEALLRKMKESGKKEGKEEEELGMKYYWVVFYRRERKKLCKKAIAFLTDRV